MTQDWLFSAFSWRPPSQPRSPRAAGGGSPREPEGSGLRPDGGSRKGAGGCGAAAGGRTGAGPWPGRGAWRRAGWAASCCCQVSSAAGRGPGRAAFQAWELGGGASPSLGPGGGGVPRKGPCASTGPGTCRHGGWAAHRRRRAAWILAGRTTTLPAPARGGVTGCLDGKLKRGAGDSCEQEPPGVLTEASVSERPGHPAVAVPTLGDTRRVLPQPQLPSSARSSVGPAPLPSPRLPLHTSTP